MRPETARWIMQYLLGKPGTLTRLVQYWTTAVVLFTPVLFALPALRGHRAIGLTIVAASALVIYFGVAWATDRVYDALARRYSFPDHEA